MAIEDDGTLDWFRLGELMEARRHELGLRQEDAVGAGKTIGIATWRKLEAGRGGQSYTYRTLLAVARALQWTPDSIEAILHGHDPEPIEDEGRSVEERLDRLEGVVTDVRDTVGRIADALNVRPPP
jgi:hypothetical protein